MNDTFKSFQKEKMKNLIELKNPFLLEKILLEFDLNLIQNESEIQQAQPFNLSTIYKRITKFYNEIIEIDFESNFFNPKDTTVENFRKLAELIAGVAAKCENNEYFLQIMQNMNEATEMFNILSERISAYFKFNDNFRGKSDSEGEENMNTAALYLRIESLNLENDRLNEEVKNLKNRISDMTKDNYNYELTLKELETKYQELLEHKNSDHSYSNDYEDNVSLSIQIFELKGKLEAKEKYINNLKESKEKAIEDFSIKLSILQKENDILKEKSRKYEVLKEKYEKSQNEDYQKIKQKLFQSEKIIKDQEEKIKKLKNFDLDKSTLLGKIQELNFELSQDREKLLEISKENNYYKETIINLESDLKFYKNQNEFLKTSQSGEINFKEDDKNLSLKELEDISSLNKLNVEFEAKLRILTNEKENLQKEKTELENNLNKVQKEYETVKIQISQHSKKIAKYTKYKEEKENYLHKISDLMEKNVALKSEVENLKLLKGKEKTETESYYNNIVSNLNKQHNEEIFGLKEISNKFENENNFLKKEIKKNEELIDSNKLYIEELQRKIYNPHSETKIVELETKLKEISSSENSDLKKKLTEREDIIVKMSEKLKILETKTKEIEKFKKLSEEINEEMMKKEEALSHIKNQLESKEKLYREEQQLVSSLFHQLALQYNILQSKMAGDEKEFTWLINNFQTMNMTTNYNK